MEETTSVLKEDIVKVKELSFPADEEAPSVAKKLLTALAGEEVPAELEIAPGFEEKELPGFGKAAPVEEPDAVEMKASETSIGEAKGVEIVSEALEAQLRRKQGRSLEGDLPAAGERVQSTSNIERKLNTSAKAARVASWMDQEDAPAAITQKSDRALFPQVLPRVTALDDVSIQV